MKTPFDDLEFKLEYNTIKSEFYGDYIHVVCKLTHKDLPIVFSNKFECTDKLEKSKPGYVKENVNKLIHRLYKEVYNASIMNKSTFPFILGMNQKIYIGEWDKEKESWFVFDNFENKCYNSNEIKGNVYDEFNTY